MSRKLLAKESEREGMFFRHGKSNLQTQNLFMELNHTCDNHPDDMIYSFSKFGAHTFTYTYILNKATESHFHNEFWGRKAIVKSRIDSEAANDALGLPQLNPQLCCVSFPLALLVLFQFYAPVER